MSYNEFIKRLLTIIAIGLFLVAAWRLRNILMMTLLAAIIAVSLDIPVVRLQRLGIRRGYAIALTLIGVVIGVGLFLTWVMPPLAVQFSAIVAEFPAAFENVQAQYAQWYTEQGQTIGNFLPEINIEDLQGVLNNVAAWLSSVVAMLGGVLFNSVLNLLVIIVVSVFLLLEPKGYVRGFLALLPPGYRARALEILVELRLTVTTWMTALTFSITVTALLVTVVLGLVLGVPNALALGVIAGFATIIPNIGAVIPLVPIAIFTLADDPSKLPLVIPAYILIQLTESNILTPSIVKRELNIPAALILIFQLISASLLGFFGVLLAVPLLAIIITLVREVYVYDVLGMRGTSIDIEYDEDNTLHIVTRASDPMRDSLVTQSQPRLTGLMPQISPLTGDDDHHRKEHE